MKSIALFVFALALVSTVALDCPSGFYDPGSGATRCVQCDQGRETCTTTNFTYYKRITGYSTGTGIPVPLCPVVSLSPTVYNKDKNVCQVFCKEGCNGCLVDYDYCTSCFNGYIWNGDYTCIPAVIGLEAASLALLAIGLVFAVIGCCYVNKARK